ncbi:radical SAM protein [Amycolatopsis sp. YIM 10]|uniref:B12-binding domain-containing radical SAM protein n=1 Tax=Amycolatopsis sp. YIM 10 TaxID=2653857 RepID=UPI001D158BF1|nr:radical SAM protein [Amycolatopsis sp. YIM 10]
MLLAEPDAIRAAVQTCVGPDQLVVVTGTLDRRLVLIEHDDGQTWTAADLSGQPHNSRKWPQWTQNHVSLAEPDQWLSTASLTPEGRYRLTRPRLLLASLYHPEHFPLPRFPLAISDLARAARSTLLGHVELMDMQLGVGLEEIIARATSGAVDVLGVSITFGQHDLATELLDAVYGCDPPPLVIAGGSLTARNEHVLLERYPQLLIGRGGGEPTIADLLGHWHGDLPRAQVRGIGYAGAARGKGTLMPARRTATVANRLQTDMWPELDLLRPTFACGGVAQLETSRGCTNFCSFCPRGHKGQWAGAAPEALPWMLSQMRTVFDLFPQTSRTLYLVDEEFIGRGPDAVARALSVADTLHDAGFAWETSCRIDQVVRTDRDRDWHLERAHLWRGLLERGLRRCLFGVESGVTSILYRFNKETTAEQNALAIRTLTALGVPPRFTYITFDQLMTETELRDTVAFQARTDLLIAPQPGLSVGEIVDGVRDEQWVRAHATGEPFYSAISYMLVGMECLIGAAYTRKAGAAGLTGDPDPAMGRMDARYADWRIGVLARWGQLWIDRNFALDYTLKSLEKVVDGQPYAVLRRLRRLLKTGAFGFLHAMLDQLTSTAVAGDDPGALDARCAELAQTRIHQLRADLGHAITGVLDALPPRHQHRLHAQYQQWSTATAWRLINAADPCGT